MDWRDELRENSARRRAMYAHLVLRYPYQFRTVGDRDFFTRSPAFEEGWLPVFERLCEAVDAALTNEERATFAWTQVKEKWGGLRCYFTIAALLDMRTNIDWRREGPDYTSPPPPETEIIPELRALIAVAEREADVTCEKCGARPATLFRSGHWQTMCAGHTLRRELGDDS